MKDGVTTRIITVLGIMLPVTPLPVAFDRKLVSVLPVMLPGNGVSGSIIKGTGMGLTSFC